MPLALVRQGHGPKLVLLHGWAMHGGVWSSLVPQLAERFEVLVVDLPGHGRSPFTGATLDDWLDEILPAVGGGAVWVGWSLGALLALTAAARVEPAPTRMVLVSATPRFVRASDWPWAMALSQLQQFGSQLEQDYAQTLMRFLTLQLGPGESRRALLRKLRCDLLRDPPDKDALQLGLRILATTDLRSALSRINVPTLVLHGGRDSLVPVAAATFLAQRLARARLVLCDTAGHVPFLSHPQEFLRALKPFLHAREQYG